jgi:hypothetical protein
MKQNMRQRYNDTINLISHLILTKPKPVMTLLMKYGVRFEEKPTKKELADEVVELLKSTNEKFQEDLSNLLTVHIQFRGKEMLALDRSKYSSYDDGDEDEDEFWGALAKGAVGIIGGLFGKKRRRRRRNRGGGNAAALAASRAAAAKRQADAQAARVRRDFQMKMQAMEAQRRREQEAARRRQEAAERRRREEAERRRREDEARSKKEAESKKKSNMMLMVGGVIGLLAIAGIFMAKSNSQKPMMPYVPPQPISNR